jgi:hypothetical protein
MDLGGEVLVSELRSTVADDDVGVGSVADRCLLSGVIQTSCVEGVTTVFDPERTFKVRGLTAKSTAKMPCCLARPRLL